MFRSFQERQSIEISSHISNSRLRYRVWQVFDNCFLFLIYFWPFVNSIVKKYVKETFEKLDDCIVSRKFFQLTHLCGSKENAGVVNCNYMILFKEMPLDKKFWKKSGGVCVGGGEKRTFLKGSVSPPHDSFNFYPAPGGRGGVIPPVFFEKIA